VETASGMERVTVTGSWEGLSAPQKELLKVVNLVMEMAS